MSLIDFENGCVPQLDYLESSLVLVLVKNGPKRVVLPKFKDLLIDVADVVDVAHAVALDHSAVVA